MGDERDDQFDDLFEPFELDSDPTPEQLSVTPPATPSGPDSPPAAPPPPSGTPTAPITTDTTSCPSCGSSNPSFNHHCERCGSRLNSDPMPIAPAPGSRTTAGARAIGVLAAVVLIVVLIAAMMNIFSGGDPEVTGPETSSTTSSLPSAVTPIEITPTGVTASSELSDQYSPDNLIDGDPETRWNDKSARGIDAWIEFTFAPPVSITEMEFQNVADDDKFQQNYKIQGYTISVDDLNVPIPGRLVNSNEPQRVRIASVETIKLRIEVSTTYPAQPVGDNPGFDELALQGIRFFGVEK